MISPPDVPHFDALKEKVDSLYMVDRAFGVGYSLGGAQVFDYAVSRPTALAAVVSVLGANPGAELDNVDMRVPFPAMMVAGTADTVLPFEGGPGAIGGNWPPVVNSVEAMIAHNQCDPTPVVTEADYSTDDVTTLESSQYMCASYTTGAGEKKEFDFQFVKLDGAAHGYPGQEETPPDLDLLFPVSQEIGTPEFFEFLFQHDYRASIPGDFNHDTVLGIEDVDRMAKEMIRSRPDTSFDLNADDDVTLADLDELLTLANRKNGDANFDGAVSFADFLTLSANFGGRGKTWSQGNFNGDKKTDFDDFLVFSTNFGLGEATGLQAVPEPATTMPIWALGLLIRRRSRVN